MTPRRVGFLCCSCAPPRAEPAGPSVWCTMMLRQGWAFAGSPHGASQTIFRPGISGVPDDREMVARSGVWAETEKENARENVKAQSAAAAKRRFMISVQWSHWRVSRPLARGHIRIDGACEFGDQRRRRVEGRKLVAAALLGVVQRLVGGRDQQIGLCAHLRRPLRDADRDRDRNIGADALLGARAADFTQ